jgi:hypothetical protein
MPNYIIISIAFFVVAFNVKENLPGSLSEVEYVLF